MTATPNLELLLLAGRAIFLVFSFVIAAVTFTAWRRATQAQSAQMLAQARAVTERLTSLEARFDATRRSITQLSERVERQTPASTAAAPPYHIAIRLARSGASREEIMRCGLSQGEAELVQRLHGAAASATA